MVQVCGYPLIYLIVTAALTPSCALPSTFHVATSGATSSCTLHTHLTSWLQASDAIGSVLQKGSQALLSLSRVQPHHSGDGACCWGWSAVVQMLVWSTSPFECCNNAPCVGGSTSIIILSLWQNSSLRDSSTELSWLSSCSDAGVCSMQ